MRGHQVPIAWRTEVRSTETPSAARRLEGTPRASSAVSGPTTVGSGTAVT